MKLREIAARFEEKFSEGTEFLDIEELSVRVKNLGLECNTTMETRRSDKAAGRLWMTCKHGEKYRAAKGENQLLLLITSSNGLTVELAERVTCGG